METLTESALVDYSKNEAIKRLYVVQQESGNFAVEVELTWKKGRLVLITQTKKIREWSNLSRLVDHIQKNYEYQNEFTVTLRKKTI